MYWDTYWSEKKAAFIGQSRLSAEHAQGMKSTSDLYWHFDPMAYRNCCPIKVQYNCCLCTDFVCFLHITSMTCWYSSWRCGKLAVFTSHGESIILLPFWLAKLVPDNFHVRLGDWANLWKAKQHQPCASCHIEVQAIGSQLMSPGRFIHFGSHPSANVIMTGKNTFARSLC